MCFEAPTDLRFPGNVGAIEVYVFIVLHFRCAVSHINKLFQPGYRGLSVIQRIHLQDKHGSVYVKPKVLKQLFEPAIAAPWDSVTIERPLFPVDDTFDTFGMGFQIGTYRGKTPLGPTRVDPKK